MHEEIGLNFAAALRSFLRQDPNIIMVGEIRDFETAEIAVKAALTGHLVLSTLHTNDAPVARSTACSTWASSPSWWRPRSTASWPSASRAGSARSARRTIPRSTKEALVERRLHATRRSKASTSDEGPRLPQLLGDRLQGPRRASTRSWRISEELKEFVLNGASAIELKREAIRHGMMTLRRSALNKLAEGTTTLSRGAAASRRPDH